MSLFVTVEVYRLGSIVEDYLVIAPGIRLGFMADGLSAPTLSVVLLLCTALAFYSIRYVEHRVEILYYSENELAQASYYARFFYLLPFFPIGFIGTILSTNLVVMYFFLEVLTVCSVLPDGLLRLSGANSGSVRQPVVGHHRGARFFWSALSWSTARPAASRSPSCLDSPERRSFLQGVILLFVVSLMMKLAVVPFHVWMPSVHAEHPTCIAGLLAVYANLAVYILIRVTVLPLGDEFARFGPPLMVLALVTMVYGSLLSLAQTDIKRLAACSTISQIAYSVLGLAALTSSSVEGSMFFFLSHIMGKTVFFSTAGIVVYVTGIRDMDQLGGLARKMPVTAGLWIVGCMMLSGFPPFSSFTAEWIMFTGIFERGAQDGPLTIAVAIGGITAILLTVAYTFGAARRVFFGPLNPELAEANLSDPGWTMTVPLMVVAGLSMALGLYPRPLMELLHAVIGGS